MLARSAAVSSLDFATTRRSADDLTLHLLVDAIAEEVAAKVKSEVAAYVQQIAGKVQPVLLNVKDAAVYLGRSEQAVQAFDLRKGTPGRARRSPCSSPPERPGRMDREE